MSDTKTQYFISGDRRVMREMAQEEYRPENERRGVHARTERGAKIFVDYMLEVLSIDQALKIRKAVSDLNLGQSVDIWHRPRSGSNTIRLSEQNICGLMKKASGDNGKEKKPGRDHKTTKASLLQTPGVTTGADIIGRDTMRTCSR